MNIKSEQAMLTLGEKFAKTIKPNLSQALLIELVGDVGAGKTTFVRGLAKGLGIKNVITSPSFTISKSYALQNNGHLIHYDFYRLTNPGLMSEDLQENLANPNNIIIIEWSDSVKKLLPQNHIVIKFIKNGDDTREVEIKSNRNNTFRNISRPTGSELTRSPVTTEQRSEQELNKFNSSSKAARSLKTGATKHVEKGTIRLYLDTSTPETILKINNQEYKYNFNNDLAEKLLQFIHDKLQKNNKTWQDITEITFMSGPGSFTGLRIGATIVNTLARELNIPLYDHHGQKHLVIIPEYGHPANISQPQK